MNCHVLCINGGMIHVYCHDYHELAMENVLECLCQSSLLDIMYSYGHLSLIGFGIPNSHEVLIRPYLAFAMNF